ncbi:uncharacterized protein LOC141641063 [Silene latifolia]|uniref:uncharacterized protein LOC141641063 n=1 Tax=Silene latifolia TaxID=37657 RepID=UPI003D77F608
MVPNWIRFYGLPLKFWGNALKKIARLGGNPLRCDSNTQLKTFLGYARIMVEFKDGDDLPDFIEFMDELAVKHKQILLKQPLKALNAANYANIETAANVALIHLHDIQSKLQLDPSNVLLQQNEKNRVFCILDRHGVLQDTNAGIEAAFEDYYKNLLGTSKWVGNVHVLTAVKEFFTTIKLLKQVNSTTLTLIPIKHRPLSVSDFRPISCCNVLYKIISKVICNRMANVLPEIISANQSAFIKGREIVDNILICQDLVRLYKRKSCYHRCIMKIDLKKAYDSIEWQFIEQMLFALKFPDKLVQWIMRCVSYPWFTLSLNGSTFGYFQGKRGIRQGDPMSPLIFTICMEYLSRVLRVVTEQLEFNYHSLYRTLKLSHLCFADDLLIFCRGDRVSIKVLLRAFATFSFVSGLEMNCEKSEIYFNGLTQGEIDYILSISGLKEGSFPFKYLWIPISYKRMAIGDFLDRITAICRNYLWSSSDQYGRAPSEAWDSLCTEKKFGGLGIVNCRLWNQALIGKYTWWLACKSDHLWIKWVDHVYMKGRNWQDYVPSLQSSWTWRKICAVKDIFKPGYLLNQWCDGKYTVTAGYRWLQGSQTKAQWALVVWNRLNVPKHSFIAWLFAKERLLTKDRLRAFGLPIDGICDLCAMHTEDHNHLFYQCAFSIRCWAILRQ